MHVQWTEVGSNDHGTYYWTGHHLVTAYFNDAGQPEWLIDGGPATDEEVRTAQ